MGISKRIAKGDAEVAELDMLMDVTKQIEGHTICAFGEGSSWPDIGSQYPGLHGQVSSFNFQFNINLIFNFVKLSDVFKSPKKRYEIMRKYMPSVGRNGLDMMHRTCATQVNLDYLNEVDYKKKIKINSSHHSCSCIFIF